VEVVEDDDQGRRGGQRLEELPEAPRDLLGSGRRPGRAERHADAERREVGVRAGAQRLAQVADLVDDLGERPVGDSLPIREAAADHDGRVNAGGPQTFERVRDEREV